MSKLDGLFESAAKAIGPILAAQIDRLWPKIDAKIDELLPQILAAIVPAITNVLEAFLPKITEKIIAEIMERLPEIINSAIRAVVPDAMEGAFPIGKLADELAKRLGGMLGGLGRLKF